MRICKKANKELITTGIEMHLSFFIWKIYICTIVFLVLLAILNWKIPATDAIFSPSQCLCKWISEMRIWYWHFVVHRIGSLIFNFFFQQTIYCVIIVTAYLTQIVKIHSITRTTIELQRLIWLDVMGAVSKLFYLMRHHVS